MPRAHLEDRGIVLVSGEDAKALLQGLVTCDMDGVAPARARFGALLSPQGKILFDFHVAEAAPDDGGGYYLDTIRGLGPDLVRRLTMYKLRAKVLIEDRSDTLGIVAAWGGDALPAEEGLLFDDARLPALGQRLVTARDHAATLTSAPADAYYAHRIALGVPESGKDFMPSDAFPHEACMDALHGVDFDKGCYVGQEVVSRMQHRGTGGRTRVVPVVYEGGFAAAEGVEVTAGGRAIGTTGSQAGGRGLAKLRLDRVAEAMAAGESITAGGIRLHAEKPAWARFAFPGEEAAHVAEGA